LAEDKNINEEQSGSGSLTCDTEVEDVLAGCEPWEPIETKMVVWSFVIAAIALILGLVLVPTSILH
jgi:hypothetical protein